MHVCEKRQRLAFQHYQTVDSLNWPVAVKSYLVLMAGALAVFSDGFQRLPHQVHVALINVKSQQAEASGGASADTIQELQSLAHQVVVGFVVLAAQEVLKRKEKTKVRWSLSELECP